MRCGFGHHARRAFTLVELLIAMSLSLIVLAALFATLVMSSNAARVTDQQMNERVDVRLTQLALQRTARSLVGGIPATTPPPEETDEEGGGAGSDPSSDGSDSSSSAGSSNNEIASAIDSVQDDASDEALAAAQSLLGGGGGGSGGLASEDSEDDASPVAVLSNQIDPYSEPDYFILEYEELGDGRYVQRLVVMLRESPLPLTAEELAVRAEAEPRAASIPSDVVYGAFELRETEEDGWVLQWSPIEPTGTPQVLVRGVTRCEWSVLPRGLDVTEWPDQYSAYLAEDIPFVFRLVLETESGVREDWVFETNVITRGT